MSGKSSRVLFHGFYVMNVLFFPGDEPNRGRNPRIKFCKLLPAESQAKQDLCVTRAIHQILKRD